MLTGAIIMASIGSPGWEIRELVAVDSRASSAVPGGKSCADKAKENRNIEIARKENSWMRTALLSGGTLRPSSKSVLILHFVWPLLPLIRVNLQFMFDTGSRWLLLSKCIKVPQSIDHPSRHAVSSIGSPSTPGPAEKPKTSYYRR